MNKYETYRLKIQHCREMAQRTNGPLEKECWLIVADSWTRLLQMIEPPNNQSVRLIPDQAESSHPKPSSVNFCQFSLIERQMQS
jgi:hypothetical protein